MIVNSTSSFTLDPHVLDFLNAIAVTAIEIRETEVSVGIDTYVKLVGIEVFVSKVKEELGITTIPEGSP